MSCTEVVAIDLTTEASDQDIIDVVVIDNSVEATVSQTIEVDVVVNQWSLVSDAIYIRDITGEEPQWFQDMVDNALWDNDQLNLYFSEIQTAIDALDAGYTNLVSITDEQATHIEALKVSSEKNTAAITHLETVSITEQQAYAISHNTITAWMRGGESGAWFDEHVQAVATPTSANTLAITQLGAEVDGISSTVTSMSEALVYKYQNPEWDEASGTDPDGSGNPQWVYEARAKHSLEVNANGAVSGFIATAESCDPNIPGCELGSRSAFKIYADEFLVCDKADPVTNEPGYVAFSIRFNAPADPVIVLNGDVYFGDITPAGGVETPYNLSDIASDLVVDPVEKDALERTFRDIRERDAVFQALVYTTGARYGSLRTSSDPDVVATTVNYTTGYQNLQCAMSQLGIIDAYIAGDPVPASGDCFGIDPATYVGQIPYAPTPISSRDDFNDIFSYYDEWYNKLDGVMSDLVKEIADNSYNILVEYFSDGILSAEEKANIINYLANEDIAYNNATAYMTSIGAIPDCITYPYPGNGFEPYSRAGIVYVPYRKYGESIYTTAGTPIDPICPCSSGCPPLPNQPLNGFNTQMNLAVYDLHNAVDTVLDEAAMTDALASFSWFLSSRTAYADALSSSVIDTTFIKIENPITGDYTLIVDETIETGVIGDATFVDPANTTRANGIGIDFIQSKMRIDTGLDDTTFILDSEAVYSFVGICSTSNIPNIRGGLVEGSVGSFGQLYGGDVVTMVDGIYPIKNLSVKRTDLIVHMYELGDEEFHTGSVRFFSSNNATNSSEVNDYRMKSSSASIFTANINGSMLDRLSLVDVAKLETTLEISVDDGLWTEAPNQIIGATSDQMIVLDNMFCLQHIDFRLKVKYSSNGFPYMQKNVILTIMLNN